MSACEPGDHLWPDEIRVKFDADEMASFFDAFVPLESLVCPLNGPAPCRHGRGGEHQQAQADTP